MPFIKPMLGINCDLSKLQFPIYASTKLDGIRVIIQDSLVLSRNGKPIPNKYVRDRFSYLNGLDGELIYGSPTASDVFRQTTHAVMTKDNDVEVSLYAFDCWNASGGILERYKSLLDIRGNDYKVHIVEQILCNTLKELQIFEEKCLESGYEGVIIRYPNAPYKFGRSTLKEGALLKLKRFSDSEAQVLGFEPLEHNTNEATKNALGRTERSSCKEGKVTDNLLGAFLVRDTKTGIEFSIGSGFTLADRRELWDNRGNMMNELIKYKYFSTGVKDKPRFPIFLGFRGKNDV